MKKEMFEELKGSLKEMVDHATGKRSDLRTTSLPRPPKVLSKDDIATLRSDLKVSQAVFAGLLNISVRTVQAWEQGNGRPSGPSLKLLAIAKKNPKILYQV